MMSASSSTWFSAEEQIASSKSKLSLSKSCRVQ
jgi:hypothetical protein